MDSFATVVNGSCRKRRIILRGRRHRPGAQPPGRPSQREAVPKVPVARAKRPSEPVEHPVDDHARDGHVGPERKRHARDPPALAAPQVARLGVIRRRSRRPDGVRQQDREYTARSSPAPRSGSDVHVDSRRSTRGTRSVPEPGAWPHGARRGVARMRRYPAEQAALVAFSAALSAGVTQGHEGSGSGSERRRRREVLPRGGAPRCRDGRGRAVGRGVERCARGRP